MDANITIEEFPINHQNASALANKRWNAWRAARDARIMQEQAELLNPAPKPPVQSIKSSDAIKEELNQETLEQVRLIDEKIKDYLTSGNTIKPSVLKDLSLSKTSLWKLLFPQPKASRSRRDYSPAEPIE